MVIAAHARQPESQEKEELREIVRRIAAGGYTLKYTDGAMWATWPDGTTSRISD